LGEWKGQIKMADYGINLKSAIKAKKLTVYKLSRMTGIPATTIYSSIQRNSGVRYDRALRIADVLKIRPEEICGHALTSTEDRTKYVENIEEILRQIRETRRREHIKRHLEILRTYDVEHLKAAEDLLDRFGRLDLSSWCCVKEMMEVALRYNPVKPGEGNMDWRKELEKAVGVTDEKNVADLTDMEGREILGGDHLSYLKTVAADEQRTGKG